MKIYVFLFNIIVADSTNGTEHSGRVVNTPTPYSGGPGFDSRTLRTDILIDIFMVFLSPSTRMPG
jgi:hypothetical protein